MIIGKQTNKVYMSELLRSDRRFNGTCTRLIEILNKHSIPYKFLKATSDIWCRDYMPIQIRENQFVQFRYEPSYLGGKWENLRSNPKEVCKANCIKPVFSNINLDGGNVVSWSDRVIISDRVFDENYEFSDKNKLTSELEIIAS